MLLVDVEQDQGPPKRETGPIYSKVDRLRAMTRTIHAGAERVTRELAGAPTNQLARSIESLTEQLVSNLVPFLAAEEDVGSPIPRLLSR